MTARTVLIALALAASAQAHAFSCSSTGSLPCRLELSTLTILFESGIYNFEGDSQSSGNDAHVQGFTTGAGDFPNLTEIDTAGGRRVGFSLSPGMSGQVGGSGFDGYHEVFASFAFNDLQFIAKPGWQVDAVTFSVEGARSRVGNGYVALGVPGTPRFHNGSFVSSHTFELPLAQYQAYFMANASYLQGEDGTADDYGTASASFNFASLVAHVSAVPEPGTTPMALLGSLMLGVWLRCRRPLPARPAG